MNDKGKEEFEKGLLSQELFNEKYI